VPVAPASRSPVASLVRTISVSAGLAAASSADTLTAGKRVPFSPQKSEILRNSDAAGMTRRSVPVAAILGVVEDVEAVRGRGHQAAVESTASAELALRQCLSTVDAIRRDIPHRPTAGVVELRSTRSSTATSDWPNKSLERLPSAHRKQRGAMHARLSHS
jgi:hypothetical protein